MQIARAVARYRDRATAVVSVIRNRFSIYTMPALADVT
jgi:hypothetical protein